MNKKLIALLTLVMSAHSTIPGHVPSGISSGVSSGYVSAVGWGAAGNQAYGPYRGPRYYSPAAYRRGHYSPPVNTAANINGIPSAAAEAEIATNNQADMNGAVAVAAPVAPAADPVINEKPTTKRKVNDYLRAKAKKELSLRSGKLTAKKRAETEKQIELLDTKIEDLETDL